MQISFMAATPRHPLLRRAIDEVVKNVEARYYGPTLTQSLTPTPTLTLTPTPTPTPTLTGAERRRDGCGAAAEL